jgi:hypothetical protein
MLFRTADQALRWAYNTSARPIVKLSAVNRMRGQSSAPVDLTPYERHAQAAQIAHMVDVLELPERAYVHLWYARVITEEEHAVLTGLVAAALPPGIRSARGVEKMILWYCGHPIGQASLRYELKCKRAVMYDFKRQASDDLDRLRAKVLDALERRMVAAGLIEP